MTCQLAALGVGGSGAAAANHVLDHFTDSNGTNLTAHTADQNQGSGWIIGEGACSIQGNRAQCSGVGVDSFFVAYIETNVNAPDITSVINRVASNQVAHVFRYQDTSNFSMAYVDGATIQIYERSAGAFTQRASQNVATIAGNDYTLETKLTGNSVTATIASVSVTYGSLAVNTGGTKHGIYADGASPSGTQWDDFKVP